MSHSYTAVQWNAHKKVYDLALVCGILLFLASFVGLSLLAHPAPNDLDSIPILIIRATATCAFVMLHIILMIGPLALMSSRFAPLLYNRRHFGVSMFVVALLHAIIATLFYHGLGNENPLVSLFTANTRFDSISQFPFQLLGLAALLILFVMAATSHDYWLKNLTPGTWKALHMLVYLAYGLLVMHVALRVLQSETNPLYAVLLIFGFVCIAGVHQAAGYKDSKTDAGGPGIESLVAVEDWRDIDDGRATILAIQGQERVAIFRNGDAFSALSNVFAHQGGPLGEGQIIDDCVTCPWHGFQYKAELGQSPPPFTEKVPTYQLQWKENMLYLDPTPLPPGTPVAPAVLPQNAEDSRG